MTDIGGDCPHRKQLEHTLLHCQTQSEILQATRDNYLSIIEEFQRDLEELTVQVEQQQQQQEQQQNELLSKESQEAAESCTNILEQQNEALVCQVYELRNVLTGRDMQIEELQAALENSAVSSESIKQKTEEIKFLQKINTDLKVKVVKFSDQLEEQKGDRQKLCNKYDELMGCFEEQERELNIAIRKADSLETRLTQREQQHEEHRKERNLLREEVISLKEKLAESAGRERALNDQLKMREQDLEKSRSTMSEMNAHIIDAKNRNKSMIDTLCNTNEGTRLQIREAHNRCKEMQLKITQQTNVIEQQKNIIDSFRQWKDAQVRSDEAMRQRITCNEQQIYALVNERHSQCNEYKLLYRDYCIIEAELRRVKDAVDGSLPFSSIEHPNIVLQRGQQVHDNMNFRLRAMCETSQRLAEQNRALDDTQTSQINAQSTQETQYPT